MDFELGSSGYVNLVVTNNVTNTSPEKRYPKNLNVAEFKVDFNLL